MATLLSERDSSEKHLNAARRHSRLCQEFPGCDQFAVSIAPPMTGLDTKVALSKERSKSSEDALDFVKLKERLLNGAIKTAFEQSSQYDRENVGSGTLKVLFPEGTFSNITGLDRDKKIIAVDQIIKRSESLAADHPLAAVIVKLKAFCAALSDAITKYDLECHNVKMADAEEEMAKSMLRKMYETNYLDARKAFGKDIADSIFPDLKSPPSNGKGPNTPPDSSSGTSAK